MNTDGNRLDLTLCLGGSLFSGDALDVLRGLLAKHADVWSNELHIWQDEAGRRELGGDFSEGIRKIAVEKGALFQQLGAKHGVGPNARQSGTVELRGADSSLIVVIGLDDYEFAPSAGRYLWGNTITLQISGSFVGTEPTEMWVRHFAEDACSSIAPPFTHGHLVEEWDAKNVSREGGGVMAMGLDVSRYLPGLYWLNFYGKPYCELIGKEHLLAAPAHEARCFGDGVLLIVDEHPSSWRSESSKYAAVLAHLGDKYFFLREQMDRETVAPSYALEKLPRIARFS